MFKRRRRYIVKYKIGINQYQTSEGYMFTTIKKLSEDSVKQLVEWIKEEDEAIKNNSGIGVVIITGIYPLERVR